MAKTLKAGAPAYEKAIALLQAGEPVALPTETVYGLAALASIDDAVATVFDIKSRQKSKPFSVAISSLKAAEKIAQFSPVARDLAFAFWPGALTLVLPLRKNANISSLTLAGGDTIGIRCPDIPWMASFAESGFNDPLILPSANTSGKPAPTVAHEVDHDIGDKIPMIIDGGVCKTGIASTIIAIENGKARILRQGAIAPEDLAPFDLDWIAS